MTEARLNEIARNTPRTFDGIKSAILTACEAESKLAAVAERERCAAICDAKASYAIDKAAGRDKLSGELLAQLAGIMKDTAERIRSLGPASALDEFERKVRMDEAEWWKGKFWAYLESHHGALTRTMAEERLAAAKEPHAG